MSFRYRRNEKREHDSLDQKSRLNNSELYTRLREIGRTVMMDVYSIDLNGDLNNVPKEAFEYRDNLVDAIVGAVVLHGTKKS